MRHARCTQYLKVAPSKPESSRRLIPSASSRRPFAACCRRRSWAGRCSRSSRSTPVPIIRTPPSLRPPSRSDRDGERSTKEEGEANPVTSLQFQAVGRRKESVARVSRRRGKGPVRVNDRTFEDFFPNDVRKMVLRQPLQLTETVDKFDVVALVEGGGSAGQAGAIRHGIARALCPFNGGV